MHLLQALGHLLGGADRNGRFSRYDVAGLNGTVGDSDLSGTLSVETQGERPKLTADLRSRRLDFDDLTTIFGGVKQGVGITVDLGQAQKISSVTLDLPTSAQATVYAGDQATNSGTEIGKTEGRTGQVVLEPQSEVTAQYVTIWFTSLAPSDDGRYRASLGEVTVR